MIQETMTEKELLLDEIRYYKDVVDKYIALNNEYQDYHLNPFIGLTTWNKVVAFFILYVINGVLFAIHEIDFLAIIGFIFSLYLIFFWPKAHVKSKVRKNKSRIAQIQQEMRKLEDGIKPVYLPKMYINEYALEKLRSYLMNKRADTLKEALNLFEQEKRHDEQLREINIVQQLQEMTFKRADEAATLGWFNLFRK